MACWWKIWFRNALDELLYDTKQNLMKSNTWCCIWLQVDPVLFGHWKYFWIVYCYSGTSFFGQTERHVKSLVNVKNNAHCCWTSSHSHFLCFIDALSIVVFGIECEAISILRVDRNAPQTANWCCFSSWICITPFSETPLTSYCYSPLLEMSSCGKTLSNLLYWIGGLFEFALPLGAPYKEVWYCFSTHFHPSWNLLPGHI